MTLLRWPDAARVERERMERPQLYCPVCRRPGPAMPGAGVIDLTRRLARHLFESHDPYFGAQLRVALDGYGTADDEPGAEVFYPTGGDW